MRSCFCPAPPACHPKNIHFQQILNIHSPMKINHSLLEYTRDNDTQVSELGPSEPSCIASKNILEKECARDSSHFLVLVKNILNVLYHTKKLSLEYSFWKVLKRIYITKTYLYNSDPLKPHFYLVKLGFIGVYIIFLISSKNIDEYPQSMFLSRNIKNIRIFI